MNRLEPFLHRTRIAHFSTEIALRPEIHTYSGGLGILAGDTARSAADLELPMIFVSLASRAGYVLAGQYERVPALVVEMSSASPGRAAIILCGSHQ